MSSAATSTSTAGTSAGALWARVSHPSAQTWTAADEKAYRLIKHWARMAVSLAAGLLCGVLGLQGQVAFLAFFASWWYTVNTFTRRYLGVDEEIFQTGVIDKDDPKQAAQGMQETQEAFMTSFGVFMLAWIATFNLLHV